MQSTTLAQRLAGFPPKPPVQQSYRLCIALWERLWYCRRRDAIYFPREPSWEKPKNLRTWLLDKTQGDSAKT